MSKRAILNDWAEAGIISPAQAQEIQSGAPGTGMNIGTGSAVADATGGSTVDAEARAAINDLLAELRTLGIIAT
jgi:hypothetical protein